MYKSPAKINLFLNIVGKRQDGYHLLESLFLPLALHDEMQFINSSIISSEVNGAMIEENIVEKVASKLRAISGINRGIHIKIKKNIPIGAGLGGGSSNAATTLKVLNELWDLNYSSDKLREIGVTIGADVPFFIDAVPTFVRGIGEILTPIKLKKSYYLLLVNSGGHVSTPTAYKMGFETYSPSITDVEKEVLIGKNDMEKNAIVLCPEITDVLAFIAKQQGVLVSRMSGSGATCFGLFDTPENLNKAYDAVPKNYWKYKEIIL